MDGITEARLVVDQPLQPVEIATGAILDQRPPQLDDLHGRRRRWLAGQPLAHDHRNRFLERSIGAIGDLVELAPVETVVEHGRKVLRHAGHAAGADRFDAGLLDRLEHGTRLLPARHQLAMHHRIVAGELERNGIGMTAHDRGVPSRELARRLGQPRLAADDAGALGGERDLELRLPRDGSHATGHRSLERLGRALLGEALAFDVGAHREVVRTLSRREHNRRRDLLS